MIDFAYNGDILEMKQGGDNILQNIRYEKILKKLKTKRSVQVSELAQELEISESTVRRDINELDRLGKLVKVHGGAISVNSGMVSVTTDVSQRKQKNIDEKEKIARYAAALIEDNDFVYIDSGTTTELMIDYLENRRATYVTNGITHAKKLMERGLSSYVIGGALRASTEAAIGAAAVDAVKNYNFTKCFMGANGIDIEKGFSTPDVDEAAIKGAVVKQTYAAYILADHTKFGRVSSVTFASLDKAVIITDSKADEEYHRYTEIKEVEK